MTKMTYVQAIDTAINFLNENIQYGDDFSATVEKLEALKVQLAKRSSGKKGLTKTQKANVEVKETIKVVLAEVGEMVTVTELISDERLSVYTNQKISALLRQLVEAGEVTKVIEGKKARFGLAE